MINKILAAILLLAFFKPSFGQRGYALYKTIAVGDNSGWDYAAVDTVHRNIYFSHAVK